MPPVHPPVVHFPVALMTFSVIADLLGYFSNNQTLQATGTWALFGAGIGAAVAIVAGLFDMKRAKLMPAVHKRVHVHMRVGLVLFVAIAGLTAWRWVTTLDPHHGLGLSYLVPACLVLALTLFQGWLGGELVFTHGVGVATPMGQDGDSPNKTTGHLANAGKSEHGAH